MSAWSALAVPYWMEYCVAWVFAGWWVSFCGVGMHCSFDSWPESICWPISPIGVHIVVELHTTFLACQNANNLSNTNPCLPYAKRMLSSTCQNTNRPYSHRQFECHNLDSRNRVWCPVDWCSIRYNLHPSNCHWHQPHKLVPHMWYSSSICAPSLHNRNVWAFDIDPYWQDHGIVGSSTISFEYLFVDRVPVCRWPLGILVLVLISTCCRGHTHFYEVSIRAEESPIPKICHYFSLR